MYTVKQSKLSEIEQTSIRKIVNEVIDEYRDFYLTKNNLRLFIRENLDLLFENVEKGDLIVFSDNSITLMTGFADKSSRKYLKVLARTEEEQIDIINKVLSTIDIDLYIKPKKNNPLVRTLKKLRFVFVGGRGEEILMFRKAGEMIC